MKRSSQKLEKVNERLYRETEGEGRPLNWHKNLETLDLKLCDVQLFSAFTVEGEVNFKRPFENTDAGKKLAEIKANRAALKEHKELSTEEMDFLKKANENIIKEVFTEGKEKKSKRRIHAIAVFQNRSINLIENGEITSFSEGFRVADFICNEGEGLGFLGHTNEEVFQYEQRAEPYISIQTYLPNELFEKLWSELKEKKFSELGARVRVDVFQSEMERSLSEPWHHQQYTIEKGSYENFCGLTSIGVNGKKMLSQHKEKSWLKNEERENIHSDSNENAFLLEIKRTNTLIKWLISSIFLLGFFILISNS